MLTTGRMYTLGPSDRSTTGVNNTILLKKQNEMNICIEDLEAPKELNETDTEVMSLFKNDSEKDDTIERKSTLAH